MPSSSIQGETSQRNKLIVEELDKLANAYALRKDTWRSHGYRKAINAIIMYDKEITTFQVQIFYSNTFNDNLVF